LKTSTPFYVSYKENNTVEVDGLLVFKIEIVIDNPKPIRTLNMGPAMQPVIAISPNPLFVIATSAVISPRQFPQAIIVSAKSASGN